MTDEPDNQVEPLNQSECEEEQELDDRDYTPVYQANFWTTRRPPLTTRTPFSTPSLKDLKPTKMLGRKHSMSTCWLTEQPLCFWSCNITSE